MVTKYRQHITNAPLSVIVINTVHFNGEQNFKMQNGLSVINTTENRFKQHCTATVTSENSINRYTVDVTVCQLR